MSVLSSPRRRLMVAWVVVLIALSLFLSFYHDAAWSVARQWNVPFVTDAGLTAYNETGHAEQVRVAILETGGTHDEVTAALVTAFGGQADIELTLMLRRQRYNMEEIMNSFELASPISKIISHNDLASVVSNGPRPHVLVSTTCELDLESKAPEFRELLATGETYLFCLVHHADRWRESKHTNVVREYIEKDMADFLALSPHTADFLHSDTDQRWEKKLNYTVNVMPPVFNVNTAEPDPNEISLAMQGDYSESRRNYQHTFEQLGHVIGELRDKKVSDDEKKRKVRLHVIGHGKPPSVPEELKRTSSSTTTSPTPTSTVPSPVPSPSSLPSPRTTTMTARPRPRCPRPSSPACPSSPMRGSSSRTRTCPGKPCGCRTRTRTRWTRSSASSVTRKGSWSGRPWSARRARS
jgi:hypothetical protein